MKAKFDVLLVAGMHRSGTSAMARLAGDIGYYLGDNLLSPNSDNPRGFYEDATLMQFNMDFLEKTTGDGEHGNIKSHVSTIHNASEDFDSHGVQTYLTENGFLGKPSVFKDPRLCLTFPLWKSLLTNIGKDIACLVPFRNPLEVARSLERRNGFSLDYGLSLWFIYNVSLLKNIIETPACFVDYNDLMNDSSTVIKNIIDFACVDTNERLSSIDEYQQKFITKTLRHHTENSKSLQNACSKLPMVALLYEDMKTLSEIMIPTENDIRRILEKYIPYMFYDRLFAQNNVKYQLFIDLGLGYSEEDSITIPQPSNVPSISFPLPQGVYIQNIRLDVGDSPCVVKLDKVEVTYLNGKKGQLALNGHNALKEKDWCFIFATTDPQLYFKCDKFVTNIEFNLIYPPLQSTEVILKELNEERTSYLNELNAIKADLIHVQTDLAATQSDLAVAYTESHGMRGQLEAAQAELVQSRNDLAMVQNDLAVAYTESHGMHGQLEAAQAELVQTRNDLAMVQNDLAAAYTESHSMRGQLSAARGELAQTKNDLAIIQSDLAAAYIDLHAARSVLEATQSESLALRSSISWAITGPLRFGFDVLASPVRVINNFNMKSTLFALRYSKAGAALYTLFVPESLKKIINARWAGGGCTQPQSQAFLQQQVHSTRQQFAQPLNVGTIREGREPRFEPDPAWYEEKNPQPIPENCPVKLIAFYLPQFHPIPENDEWWGEGFTEWTNVTKAKPLFDGHYQPRLPGAMGFYDLRLPDVLRKQVELAKEFGIHGFCFHHYYFAGKRLLETPVNNLLANPDIDLPFCLCWANENWTRRWDGKDKEVLISQEHSPEDDIRFLDDIQTYFNDSRYLRVDGKPLLIIYKPSQFPDMILTIVRWREHAATKGQGLYLVMAQTFGDSDPNKYGFDAAVEFPPHASSNAISTANDLSNLDENFTGYIYNYESIPVCNPIETKNYDLFKTVFPSWDNTARTGTRAHMFERSTPRAYSKWLEMVISYTQNNFDTSRRFVFINAWNEWAEGAYLEPDRVYGYSYLNATAQTLKSICQNDIEKIVVPSKKHQCCSPKKVAIHLHLYYQDLLEEFIDYLRIVDINYDLFVSTPMGCDIASVKDKLCSCLDNCRKVDIMCVPNVGADIYPFICTFRESLLKYEIVGHVHTKKTLRLSILGSPWRKHLLDRMFPKNLAFLLEHVGNDKHILYPETFPLIKDQMRWHTNFNQTAILAKNLNIELIQNSDEIDFPAGNMFWCSRKVFEMLCSLNMTERNFDVGHGSDGLLAHAFERLMGFVVNRDELAHIALESPPQDVIQYGGFCPVCNQDTVFWTRTYDVKNGLLCGNCDSLPDKRMLFYEINNIFDKIGGNCDVLCVACDADLLCKFEKRESFGNTVEECIHFLEASRSYEKQFDLVICGQVLAHVLDPIATIKFLMSLCKSGGYILIQPQVSKNINKSIQRVSSLNGKMEYLHEKIYYGGLLCKWELGADFLGLIEQMCANTHVNFQLIDEYSEHYGIIGDYTSMILISK